jgi:hypothetical protein
MASSQIVVTLNTSIPGSVPFLLTKDVVQYKGKKFSSFAVYPFFDPTKKYPRDLIQKLSYDKRLEIFFIKDKFENIVLKDQTTDSNQEQHDEWKQQMKILDKEVNQLTQDLDMIKESMEWTKEVSIQKQYLQKQKEYDEKKATWKTLQERIGNQAELNFEFTIKIILSTGFPVNNYFQSIDFYGTSAFRSKSTVKGSNMDWIPFLSHKYSKMFSYLKNNGKIYTVSQVTWVNDVFNHPRYKRIVESYEQNTKTESAVSPENIQIQKEKNEKAKKRIIDDLIWIPNWKIEDLKYLEKNNYSQSQDKLQVMKKLNDLVGKYFEPDNIQNMANTIIDKIVLTPDAKSTPAYLALFSNWNKYKKAKNENNLLKQIEFKKMILSDENLEILKTMTSIDAFQKNRNAILATFTELVKLYYNELLQARVGYSQDLRPCVLKMKICIIKEKALQIIGNESSDFSNDVDKKDIEEYIQKNFKNYSVFSKDIDILRKERKINNPEWFEITLADSKQAIQKKLFQKILNCKMKPESCKKKDDIINSLRVFLDEQVTKEKGAISETVYDAYLVINVIEGEITVDNYQKVKCAFLNNSLGAMYNKFKTNTNENNVEKTKVFFSLQEELNKVKELNPKTQKRQPRNGATTKKKGKRKS